MSNTTNAIVGVASLIIGLAALSVVVSEKSNFVGVLKEGGNAFAKVLQAATNPFSGFKAAQ